MANTPNPWQPTRPDEGPDDTLPAVPPDAYTRPDDTADLTTEIPSLPPTPPTPPTSPHPADRAGRADQAGGASAWEPPQANPYAPGAHGTLYAGQSGPHPGQPGAYPGQSGPYGGQMGPHPAAAWQGQPGAAWQGPPAAPRQPRDANPLASLFDFSFTTFATPGLVKIVYLLAVVVFGGGWLLSVFGAFGTDVLFGGGLSGLMALLVGWVPALLGIAITRFVLEGVIALIRTHDRTAEIAEKLNERSDEA